MNKYQHASILTSLIILTTVLVLSYERKYDLSSNYLRSFHALQYASTANINDASLNQKKSYFFSSSYLNNKHKLQQTSSTLSYPIIDLVQDKDYTFTPKSTTTKIDESPSQSQTQLKTSSTDNTNYDYQFRKLIKTELFQYAQSYNNNENLKLKFATSLAKKLEAEELIITEVKNLHPLLVAEYNLLSSRHNETKTILEFYKNVLELKKTSINEISVVLTDIKNVRKKIKDEDIVDTLDKTYHKKSKLLVLEIEVAEFLKVVIETVELKYMPKLGNSREQLQHILSNYPNISSAERSEYLNFNWEDIYSLQSLVLTNNKNNYKLYEDIEKVSHKLISYLELIENKRNSIINDEENIHHNVLNTKLLIPELSNSLLESIVRNNKNISNYVDPILAGISNLASDTMSLFGWNYGVLPSTTNKNVVNSVSISGVNTKPIHNNVHQSHKNESNTQQPAISFEKNKFIFNALPTFNELTSQFIKFNSERNVYSNNIESKKLPKAIARSSSSLSSLPGIISNKPKTTKATSTSTSSRSSSSISIKASAATTTNIQLKQRSNILEFFSLKNKAYTNIDSNTANGIPSNNNKTSKSNIISNTKISPQIKNSNIRTTVSTTFTKTNEKNSVNTANNIKQKTQTSKDFFSQINYLMRPSAKKSKSKYTKENV